MRPQYDSYLILRMMFSYQLFFPEFDTLEDDDIIYIDFKIGFNIYTIAILSNGDIQCSIGNAAVSQKLNNTELDLLFNNVNQAYEDYHITPRSKLWRSMAPILN